MLKRRIVTTLLAATMALSVFAAGCANQKAGGNATKVGMVTDSGTIDDKSFNQGTWEGILKYETDKKTIAKKYLQPTGEQHTDYLNAINDLVEAGNKIVVTPGFKFETAVNEAADKHKDTTFILIDGSTHIADSFDFIKHDNVVCVFFNEHEAGFLAGIAAALSTKTNKLGFVGGMDIPPVQRFGWGFQAGVKYANKKYGTKAEIIDYVYQGTFNDTAAGQTLATGMYDKGADIIFHAAGGVGVGVFTEAKNRAQKGENVFVIGVDVDQYEFGKIGTEKDAKSVTLTSAMKRIDVAAYNYIDAKLNGKFPGGEIITLTLKDNGVGLPEKNPNLSEDTTKKVGDVKKEILDGTVKVPATQKELDAFLK
jgi:basic membrane protein A and related proteins